MKDQVLYSIENDLEDYLRNGKGDRSETHIKTLELWKHFASEVEGLPILLHAAHNLEQIIKVIIEKKVK
jgi:hypothetical protein